MRKSIEESDEDALDRAKERGNVRKDLERVDREIAVLKHYRATSWAIQAYREARTDYSRHLEHRIRVAVWRAVAQQPSLSKQALTIVRAMQRA